MMHMHDSKQVLLPVYMLSGIRRVMLFSSLCHCNVFRYGAEDCLIVDVF